MELPTSLHPTDQTLSNFGLGKLDDESAESVNQHLEECSDCQRRVAGMSGDSFLGRLQKVHGLSAVPDGLPTSAAASNPKVTTPPADTLPPGLADHSDYKILRELGRGGMGVVFLAENTLMGRFEVLKVVGGHLVNRPAVRDRFLREIQSAAKLQHKNIVTAYSAIRLGDAIVLAMEYIEGEDLARLVKSGGPLPVANACYFVYQAALGLQHAHERGMVHRDIKPANLILAREGKRAIVKVLDFGLAKVTSEKPTDSGLTSEGQMLGTPDYVAPEQIRDAQKADIRADIYSLGCTLYYLLTGKPPFHGEHLWDVYQAHFSMDASPLNLVRPEVPSELASLVAKMLAKEPGRRFQTPGEVAQALTRFFKPTANTGTGSSPEITRVNQAPPAPVRAQSAVPQPAVHRPASIPTPTAPRKTNPEAIAWESLIEFKETERSTNPVKPKPAVASAPGRRNHWLWPVLAAAGALFIGLFASVVFRTPNGTLVFDNLPKDAVVTADGNTITVEWPKGPEQAHAQISIPAGKHQVQVAMNGVQVTGREVTVESGQEKWFKVNYVAPSPGTVDQTGNQQAEKSPESPDATRSMVPTDAKLFSGKYYKVFDEIMSWHQARSKCQEMGGHLAIVRNDAENRFILSLLSKTALGSAWLGATDEEREGRWIWVDGSDLLYKNWSEGQPTNNGGRGPENYLHIFRDGTWNDYYDDGTGQFHPGFVCQWEPGTTKTSELGKTGTPVVNGSAQAPMGEPPTLPAATRPTVPRDAKLFSGKHYKVFNDYMSWHRARDKCRDMGGHLAIVRNDSENRFITSLLSDSALDSAWLGATDEKVEGRWIWVDGSDLRYDNWDRASGQPNNKGPGGAVEHYLITLRSRDGAWWDYLNFDMTQFRPGFVCQWEPNTTKIPEVGKTDTPVVNGPEQPGRMRRVAEDAPIPVRPPPAVAPFDAVAARLHQEHWRKHLGAPVETTNSIGMKFALIPPGSFLMGSPEGEEGRGDDEFQHRVTLTKGFYLGVHEVTRGQFARFVKATVFPIQAESHRGAMVWTGSGSNQWKYDSEANWMSPGFEQRDDHPVVCITWNDAVAYAAWLSAQDGGGRRYRLPTEAEWEYACRAGTTTAYSSGNGVGALKKAGWARYDGNWGSAGGTKPVGQFQANAWGLFDMHGNAHEWCQDWRADYSRGDQVDPKGPVEGNDRVYRSGGWQQLYIDCRSAYRDANRASDGNNFQGFRLALDLSGGS